MKAVANDVEVKLAFQRTDLDIAKDAVDALRRWDGLPDTIAVTVRNGQVILGGTVDWICQKMAAGRAVRYLKGVPDVFNSTGVTPLSTPAGSSPGSVPRILERA